jgi:hypothetical protein
MRDHRIAAISGDGISTEVIAADLSVLKALEAQGAKPPTKDLGELPLLGSPEWAAHGRLGSAPAEAPARRPRPVCQPGMTRLDWFFLFF